MANGDALMAAMGVGEITDKFISPGANITLSERLYNVALGSVDSTVTFPGVVQECKNYGAVRHHQSLNSGFWHGSLVCLCVCVS